MSDAATAKSKAVSKAGKAFELLRRDILDAHLAPETPLTISSLTERYGLGWTPLREALSRLESERLVTFSPNRGYRVAGVSRSELLDLQNARVTIESDLLRDAIRSGDEAWEQRVVAAHYALKQARPLRLRMPETELARWEQRHDAFHNALLSGGSSIWLKRFGEQISTQLHRHHRNLVYSPALIAGGGADLLGEEQYTGLLERASNMAHHTALMEATLSRDGAKALDLLVEHIGLTLSTYEAVRPASNT
jgi:GntR family transcriptional regulator, carbon starvation induced regulator